MTLVTDALPASIPNFPTHKRAQIALELYTTERTYVRGLETVIEVSNILQNGLLVTLRDLRGALWDERKYQWKPRCYTFYTFFVNTDKH